MKPRLLFSDDDDLWGPERCRLYGAVIERHGPLPGVTAVCATHKLRPMHRKRVASSVEDVEEDLRRGEAIQCGGVHQEEDY